MLANSKHIYAKISKYTYFLNFVIHVLQVMGRIDFDLHWQWHSLGHHASWFG